MVQGGEPLLHRRGDGPQHQDEGEVHPPHQGSPEHPGLLVEARNVTSDGVEEFVWPGNGQELLPPSRGHVGDVETKNKGERNHVEWEADCQVMRRHSGSVEIKIVDLETQCDRLLFIERFYRDLWNKVKQK